MEGLCGAIFPRLFCAKRSFGKAFFREEKRFFNRKKGFFEGVFLMKLLVTGGAGFIGSNYIRMRLQRHPKDEIVNLDKLTYAGKRESLLDLEGKGNYTFFKGDICSLEDAAEAMQGCEAVVNFAAESHVDRSIEDCDAFAKTNFFGVKVLCEEARKQGVKKFVQISCYDEKSRALTTDGFKNFFEIKKGDKVFSINLHTSKIEVKPVDKVIVQDYDGPMIHFKNKRINIKVTPNHRMLILNTKRKLVVESAEEASERSVFFTPKGRWEGKDKEFYNVKNYGRVKTEDLLYILGIFLGDGFVSYQSKKVKTKSGLNRGDFLKLARNQKGKFEKMENRTGYESTCNSYRIFFDIPENDKCRSKVEKVLENLGIVYHKHKGKAGTHLYFCSKEWFNFLEQCGKGAKGKEIPTWALEYSPKHLKHLFNGLMDSDGHQGKIYHTVSEKLVGGFCELCIKLGLNPSVGKRHSISLFEGRKIEGDCYYVVVSSTPKSISRKKIEKSNYKGKIWCLKVKDNKNFIVEREGKLDFCGNTDEVYGQIAKGSFKETGMLKPRNPYSAAKAGGELLAMGYFTTYGLPVVVTRSSNNYGPYQYPEKVMPLFITNLMQGKKVPLYGEGKNVRDWLYVLDNCEGIDLCLEKGKVGEIYNIGGGNELQNIALTKMILEEMGKGEEMIQKVQDRLGHDLRYSLDCKKIEKELGWKPKTEFKKGLHATVQWYKENEKWWKPLVK